MALSLGLAVVSAWAPARGKPTRPWSVEDNTRWLASLRDQLPPAVVALGPWPTGPIREGVEGRLSLLAEVGHRLHARLGLGTDPTWRAVMGWEPVDPLALLRFGQPRWRAPEKALEAYPVPRGRDDPVVDFAASFALMHLEPQRFACAFPARARFLRDHGLSSATPAIARCRALTRWVDPAEVEGVELVFVAQRWQDATASMGHVFLRFRRKESPTTGAGRSDPTVMWVAIDPPETSHYILKGLTGALRAGAQFETFDAVERRYVIEEGRDLFVYALALTEDERLYLLADVAARRGRPRDIGYAFFNENCATMAYKALRAVLTDLPDATGWMFHPHEVPSLLLKAGRAQLSEVIPSRKARARRSEAVRSRIEAALIAAGHVDGASLAALEVMTDDTSWRAAALASLRGQLAAAPVETRQAWIPWVDETLEIEAFAVDVVHGVVEGHLSTPAFEAALALRAELGEVSAREALSLPRGEIVVSGSRRAELLAGARADGLRGDGPRALLSWQTSVIDEEPGEARQAAFKRSARMRLLVNRLTLSTDGRDVALEENRLRIFETADWGRGLGTGSGWFASSLGGTFAVESLSRPREGLDLSVLVRGGAGLLLLGAPESFEYLVVRVEAEVGTFLGREVAPHRFRTVGRGGVELALPLGLPEHRWRLTALGGAAASLVGFGPEVQALTSIELTIDRRLGLLFRLEGAFSLGLPAGDGWQLMAGLVY